MSSPYQKYLERAPFYFTTYSVCAVIIAFVLPQIPILWEIAYVMMWLSILVGIPIIMRYSNENADYYGISVESVHIVNVVWHVFPAVGLLWGVREAPKVRLLTLFIVLAAFLLYMSVIDVCYVYGVTKKDVYKGHPERCVARVSKDLL